MIPVKFSTAETPRSDFIETLFAMENNNTVFGGVVRRKRMKDTIEILTPLTQP